MQDDIPDILTINTLQDEWHALQKAFRFARGFKLFLIHCEPSLAPLIAGHLHLASLDLDPVILSLGKPIDNLFLKMEEMIAFRKTGPIIVTDLSFSNSDPDCWEALVSNLNVTRDRFVKHFPNPLVLFFDSQPLGELARGAPDFFSIRSGLFSFRGEDALHFFANLDDHKKVLVNLNVKQHLAFLLRINGFQFKLTWSVDYPGIDGIAKFGKDVYYIVIAISDKPVERKDIQSLSMQYHMGSSPVPIIIFSESGFTTEAEQAVQTQHPGTFFLISHFSTFFEQWANGDLVQNPSQQPRGHDQVRPTERFSPDLEQLCVYFETLLTGVEERILKMSSLEEGRSIELLILDIERKVLQIQKDQLLSGPLDEKSSVLTNSLLRATNQALQQLHQKMTEPNQKMEHGYFTQILNYSDMQAIKQNFVFADGITLDLIKRFAMLYKRRSDQIEDIINASNANGSDVPLNLRAQTNYSTIAKYKKTRTIPLRLKTQILFYYDEALKTEAMYLSLLLNYVKAPYLRTTSFYKAQLQMMEQVKGASPDLKKELRRIWGFISSHLNTYQPTRLKTNYKRNKNTFETDVHEAIGDRLD